MTTPDIRLLGASQSAPSRPSAAPASAPAAAPAEPQDSASIGARSEAPAARPATSAKADMAAPGKPEYVPGQIIVKLDKAMGMADVNSLADRFGLTTIKHFDVPQPMAQAFGGELYQFKLRAGDTVEEAIKRLAGQPGVAYAEPNYKIHIDDPQTKADAEFVQNLQAQGEAPAEVLPNDLDSRLWGIRNQGQDGGTAGVDVGAVGAWETTTGSPNGNGPLICVIDTGVDYTHPDLAANAWTNPNEIAGDGIDNDNNGYVDDMHGANVPAHTGDPLDDNSHGTHCSGTIGGVGNNGQGVVGVNWSTNIAGAKFLTASGSGTYADAIEAVLYSTRIGARVTSNSWGGGGFSQALYDAFKASPALHICAAGNNGSNADNSPNYPAAFDLDNIVSVAAIDRNGNLADFSNWGPISVDVAAPGVDVYSTTPGGQFDSYSGTSMATPHVTGVAGLILSEYPEITNEQLKSRLMNTTVKMDSLDGKIISGGRVNAASALEDDAVAPAAVTDLTVAGTSATNITLTFTATGDDGAEGTAAAYQLRYSDQPIVDSDSWDAATVVRNLPAPSAAGTTERVNVGILPDEAKQFHFALRVLDNLGNASETATVTATSQPAAIAFRDDFEAESGLWRADAGWARVQVPGRGMVYTDSPEGSYGDNADSSLTSTDINLASVSNPVLVFSEKHDTESNFDALRVEISSDEGSTWNQLAAFDGTGDWADHAIDLGDYAGRSVKVRFRITSDGSISGDGGYIDNVRIAGDAQ